MRPVKNSPGSCNGLVHPAMNPAISARLRKGARAQSFPWRLIVLGRTVESRPKCLPLPALGWWSTRRSWSAGRNRSDAIYVGLNQYFIMLMLLHLYDRVKTICLKRGHASIWDRNTFFWDIVFLENDLRKYLWEIVYVFGNAIRVHITVPEISALSKSHIKHSMNVTQH